jgi:hypothetical protein
MGVSQHTGVHRQPADIIVIDTTGPKLNKVMVAQLAQ